MAGLADGQKGGSKRRQTMDPTEKGKRKRYKGIKRGGGSEGKEAEDKRRTDASSVASCDL